jgi:hypothetical protein
MNLNWTLNGMNGWWPHLSYPWVAHGVRGIFLSNLETGVTYQVPNVDGYPHGWLDPVTLRCTRFVSGDDNLRVVFDLTVPSMTTVDLNGSLLNRVMELRASRGHWTTWDEYACVRYDGLTVPSNVALRSVRQDGEWFASKQDNVGLHVYQGSTLNRIISQQCDVNDWAIIGVGALAGTVVYGYPRVLVAYPGSGQQDVSRSPWGEGAASGGGMLLLDVQGTTWLWTCGQITENQWGIFGGVLGEKAVIAVDLEASGLDVQVVGNDFIVAGQAATGALRVVSVPLTEIRHQIVRPVPPPPEAKFDLDKTEGPVPLDVTANLTCANLTTWRWLLDGTINYPIDGTTHTFHITAPGTHTVGLRTAPVVEVPAQTVTATAALPSKPREAFWTLQTYSELPDGWLPDLVNFGWTRFRVEGDQYDAVMAQCRKYDRVPLWTIFPAQREAVPDGIDIEIGNENNAGCDKWPQLTAAQYRQWVLDCLPVLWAKGCTVWVGAINNMSPDAHAWLREVLLGLPFDQRLGVTGHRYCDPDMDVTKPKKGYKSLAAEEAAWLDVVKGRRWGWSECGLVDASGTSGFWFWKKHWTRKAIDGHRAQAARVKRMGGEFYTVWQINDGPNSDFTNHCGIRTMNGQWKDTAKVPIGA